MQDVNLPGELNIVLDGSERGDCEICIISNSFE